MELGKRIKEYRTKLKWNQDVLAEKMFVSRQTISNWENDKSYPDIQSLLLLSNLFGTSLDQLVKGDVEKMTEVINEKDIKDMGHYSKVMMLGLVILVVSAAPLTVWLELYALIPMGIVFAPTMWAALKIEKIKKNNDIQTYKEILAFNSGEKLDEIQKQREIGKRPYQKAALVIGVAIGATALTAIIGAITLFVLKML
jgi:transcriptional regulator with XRE-family HTH domain